MLGHSLKKLMVLIISASLVSFVSITNLNAQGNEAAILQSIKDDTSKILNLVNALPAFLKDLSQTVISATWNKDDTDTFSALDQSNFNKFVKQELTLQDISNDDNKALQSMINLETFKNDLIANIDPGTKLPIQLTAQDFKSSGNQPARVSRLIPNINELTYTSLLNAPALGGSATDGNRLGYIKHASGLDYIVNAPLSAKEGWNGSYANRVKYYSYYSTIKSIQSFNGYVLGRIYADNNKSSKLQTDLTKEAISSDWLKTIAQRSLTTVVRYILLYQSQIFVILNQSLETQKQILTAQVMTNSLLMQMTSTQQRDLEFNAKQK